MKFTSFILLVLTLLLGLENLFSANKDEFNTKNDMQLKEIIVKPGKYRNKGNPAVELIKNVIDNKSSNRSENISYYKYEKYEKITLSLDSISEHFKQNPLFKDFQFVFENSDSTKLKGKVVLPIYIKETISDYFYQKSPLKEKEIIKGNKMVTINKYVDNQGSSEFVKYLNQDINIYDNDIYFLTNKILSPVSSVAPSFYRYYIKDTVLVEQEKCINLFFAGRSKSDMLFTGNMYITMDGHYAIKKINLYLDKRANINWVDDVKISQNFMKTPNNGWLLDSYDTQINFRVLKNMQGFLGERTVSYKNYNFNLIQDSIFNGAKIQYLDSAESKSNNYWESSRHEQLSKSESKIYQTMDSVQNVRSFKIAMDIAALAFLGYYDMGYVEIGPIPTFLSFNKIEGFRMRFGGRTTIKFSKKFNFQTYIAYSFTDNIPKYYIDGSYSFTDKPIPLFPTKSIKVVYQYDTKTPGQELAFVQEDNALFSIKRGVNDKLFYDKLFRVEHLNEFENHFSYKLGWLYYQESTGGNLFFNKTSYANYENEIDQFTFSELYLHLRYAPNEKFYQGKAYRHSITTTDPILELQYTYGSKNLQNDFIYQKIRFILSKRFYLSVLGYTDTQLELSKLFGTVSFPLLDLHRANQTYYYEPLNYNLMNFLEFVSDKYASLMIDHCFNGFFFNKMPLIKHWGIREMITCKILYGDISNNNNPYINPELCKFPTKQDGSPTTFILGNTPYIEGSVGISNIAKILRIDLIHRFTYLNNPNVAAWGIRVKFKLDF